MMDGSLSEDGTRPTSFDENVTVTAKVVEMAHMIGVSVEGEIGHLGSLETGRGEAEDGHGYEGELSRARPLVMSKTLRVRTSHSLIAEVRQLAEVAAA